MLGVMVVGVVVLYIWGSHYKGKDSRAEMLQRRYGLMDADKLAEVPDEELVEAVVANIMAKVDKRRPDAYKIGVSAVPRPQRGVLRVAHLQGAGRGQL